MDGSYLQVTMEEMVFHCILPCDHVDPSSIYHKGLQRQMLMLPLVVLEEED